MPLGTRATTTETVGSHLGHNTCLDFHLCIMAIVLARVCHLLADAALAAHWRAATHRGFVFLVLGMWYSYAIRDVHPHFCCIRNLNSELTAAARVTAHGIDLQVFGIDGLWGTGNRALNKTISLWVSPWHYHNLCPSACAPSKPHARTRYGLHRLPRNLVLSSRSFVEETERYAAYSVT